MLTRVAITAVNEDGVSRGQTATYFLPLSVLNYGRIRRMFVPKSCIRDKITSFWRLGKKTFKRFSLTYK